MVVHHFLKPGLAIILCCNANTLNNAILIRSAFEPASPESMDLGTIKLPTKPMA